MAEAEQVAVGLQMTLNRKGAAMRCFGYLMVAAVMKVGLKDCKP